MTSPGNVQKDTSLVVLNSSFPVILMSEAKKDLSISKGLSEILRYAQNDKRLGMSNA